MKMGVISKSHMVYACSPKTQPPHIPRLLHAVIGWNTYVLSSTNVPGCVVTACVLLHAWGTSNCMGYSCRNTNYKIPVFSLLTFAPPVTSTCAPVETTTSPTPT